MFGYVAINPQALSADEKARFRAAYCGLCHTLSARYGSVGRMTLSNDMTLLSLLLGALYEPSETQRQSRCLLHPLKAHTYIVHAATAHAADMNILLAYHKCLDDVADEHSLRGQAGKMALKKAYDQVAQRYPDVCQAVSDTLSQLSTHEKDDPVDLDLMARLSGNMLGACFVWKQDAFAPQLYQLGAALGRFIYLMDAYEDYDSDQRHHRFNPLRALHAQPDYEERMEEILTMEMAQCADAFEYLPITQDAQVLNNILYSGIWSRYAYLRKKRKDNQP